MLIKVVGGIYMETSGKNTKLTFGQKLKFARKEADLTQERLSDKLMVSRQAVTKWESDRGMPDIENLKNLSKILNVSLDYLLDNGESIDLSVIREPINLDDYDYKRTFKGRWVKKAGKKDMIVTEKYPDAKIYYLQAKSKLSKPEKIIDNAVGFLTDAPFGIPDIINGFKNIDKEFYLVSQKDKQFFVMVTDEFIESRRLSEKITSKKFEMGNCSFRVSEKPINK